MSLFRNKVDRGKGRQVRRRSKRRLPPPPSLPPRRVVNVEINSPGRDGPAQHRARALRALRPHLRRGGDGGPSAESLQLVRLWPQRLHSAMAAQLEVQNKCNLELSYENTWKCINIHSSIEKTLFLDKRISQFRQLHRGIFEGSNQHLEQVLTYFLTINDIVRIY